MGLIGCPETSVKNYHHSLRNNPEKRKFSSTSRVKPEIASNAAKTSNII